MAQRLSPRHGCRYVVQLRPLRRRSSRSCAGANLRRYRGDRRRGGSTDAASREQTLVLRRAKTRISLPDYSHPVGANRNLAIREARGYVCCLDADDLIRPTYIEKAVFLLETSGYDVVLRDAAVWRCGREDRCAGYAAPRGYACIAIMFFRARYFVKACGEKPADIATLTFDYWAYRSRLAVLGVVARYGA